MFLPILYSVLYLLLRFVIIGLLLNNLMFPSRVKVLYCQQNLKIYLSTQILFRI
ncbi:hypothetical protein C0J52_21551 [Blattella germanica]|nr:hypothetical protein C0J52_21551 [Blattella germanica]